MYHTAWRSSVILGIPGQPPPHSTAQIQKFKISPNQALTGPKKRYRVRLIPNIVLNDILEVVRVKRCLKCVLEKKFK
jgi:hypothetical protein